MKIQLRPLEEQVIFITGATSGIGLAIVHQAVQQGAKVFMTARNADELKRIQDEMGHKGYETSYSVIDVAEEEQLQFAVDQCMTTFGHIDTFINNAGLTIYGKLLDTSIDEAKRLFDTNFWGVVNGCKVAVRVMRKNGGAIINIGSVLSNVALPIQGLCSASKHAVKAYTDTLRRELMVDKIPIQVTLIIPGSIDTPYPEHARSHIGQPRHTPPVYSAEVVAKAVMRCAVRPTRELGIGASSYIFPIVDKLFPALQDKFMSLAYMENSQRHKRGELPREQGDEGILFRPPSDEGHIKGHYPGHVAKSSIVTEIVERKGLFGAGAAALAGVVYLLNRRFRENF